ncbi:MAG: hypothetical protein HN595_08365, partial [Flavobacteriaceae bacterium]|nr:hypothetical protein [Flavobacteriaceae bacterium]
MSGTGPRPIPRTEPENAGAGPPPRGSEYLVKNDLFGFDLGAIFDQYTPAQNDDAGKINDKYKNLRTAVQNDLNAELSKVFVTLKRKDEKIYKLIKNIKDDFIGGVDSGNGLRITSNKVAEIKKNLNNLDVMARDDYARGITTVDGNIDNFKRRSLDTLPNLINVSNEKIGTHLNLGNDINERKFGDNEMEYERTVNIENPENRNIVQTRLNNCYVLEHKYLQKHQELMNVFAFSLNLFDKYNNALSLLMFLIKYLVQYNTDLGNKAGEYDTDCNIKIPKTVIKNMGQLINDQKSVQNIINQMNDNIKTHNFTNPDTIEEISENLP